MCTSWAFDWHKSVHSLSWCLQVNLLLLFISIPFIINSNISFRLSTMPTHTQRFHLWQLVTDTVTFKQRSNARFMPTIKVPSAGRCNTTHLKITFFLFGQCCPVTPPSSRSPSPSLVNAAQWLKWPDHHLVRLVPSVLPKVLVNVAEKPTDSTLTCTPGSLSFVKRFGQCCRKT